MFSSVNDVGKQEKAVRYQIIVFHGALITLAIETEKSDVSVAHKATTLAKQLKMFSFTV